MATSLALTSSTTRRTGRAKLGAALLAAGTFAATMGLASAPAHAADPPPDDSRLETVRLCDLSACFTAWRTVDSDGDGVSDADEMMAGTDAHDPKSHPGVRELTELTLDRHSPTFEAGQAFLQVLPAELVAIREKAHELPTTPAFPGGPERGDSLTRAGISADLMKDHGLDLERDGFTLGLEAKTKDEGLPPMRIGGIDIRLISVVGPDGKVVPDDPADVPALNDHGPVTDVLDNDFATSIWYKDGTNVVVVKETGETKVYPPGSSPYYSDPDADPGVGAEPTEEQKLAWERMHGAVVHTIEGWSAPPVEGEPEDPRATVILIDPEYVADFAVVTDLPRVTTAQPETRDDMPKPGDIAPPPGNGGCYTLC